MSNLFAPTAPTDLKKKLPATGGNLFAPTAPAHLRKPLKSTPVQPDLTPDDPPDPVVSKAVGTPMSVKAFNAKLQAVTDSHVSLFGYAPKPAEALHAVSTMVPGKTPGLVEPGNIDIHNRPVAHNKDGSISTVRTISIGTDKGETLIPTVIGGKVVSDKAAIAYYRRTGENLGTFDSVASANAYSIRLHDQQADEYLPVDVSTLFGPGKVDAAVAKAQAALAAHPPETDSQFIKSLAQAAAGDAYGANGAAYHAFMVNNDARIQQLQGDKKLADRVHGIILGRSIRDGDAHRAKVDAAGLLDPGIIARPIEQISQSLVHSPGGVVTMVTSIAKDLADLPINAGKGLSGGFAQSGGGTAQPATAPFSRTSAIADAMVHQVGQDFRHPKQNAGYLFLDLVGFASLGAGGVARAGAAARAVSALDDASIGTKVATAATTFAEKPPLQRATVRLGDYSEEVPLSSNPLAAVVQKRVLGYRQQAADTRHAEGPSAVRSILMPEDGFLDRNLSFERKVGRESDARLRAEHAASMALANQLHSAAGSAVAATRVVSKLPYLRTLFAKNGLTRGEQKAIQAASWDIQGGILDKIDAEEQFHRSMINMQVGSEKAHLRQIGDLALARKAVADQRPRFREALDLTQHVIAEQERQRIEELGLAPLTAEGRVAKAGKVLRSEELAPTRGSVGKSVDLYQKQLNESNARIGQLQAELNRIDNPGSSNQPAHLQRPRALVQANFDVEQAKAVRLTGALGRARAAGAEVDAAGPPIRVADDSFYLPTQPRGKVKRGPSQVRGRFGVSPGPYGVSPGRVLPELNHDFSGEALRAGNFRIDATNLAYEAYARTARAVTVKNQWNDLWEAGTKGKRSGYDIPIRDANTISDALREVVARIDEGTFARADADLLPADIRAMTDELYPDERTLKPEEMEHVRWIDGRLLGELEGAPSRSAKTAAQIADTINAPFRFTALYLRPAYALNKLGNHTMLVFDQGFLNAGTNLARAMSLEKTDGEANAASIRTIVGAGKAQSYVTGATGHLTRSVADFWSRFADRDERVASFLYYADRLGYKTAEDRHRLLHDKASSADLTEATRRSKKALVEFDNLTAFEKNVVRHVIFVYPWVRGATVWSLRAVMEHPAKTDLLSQLGREEINNDPLLDAAATWYKRVGYFPVGWAIDKSGAPIPKVVNPTSISTFSTIDELLNVGKALSVGDATASFADILGPAASTFAHAGLGVDEYGNKYPDGQLLGALEDQMLGLPQLSVLNKKKPHAVTPFDIRDRSSLAAHEHSMAKQAVFGPGWQGALGKWLAGGFDPRTVNPEALKARGFAELPPAERIKHEAKLLDWALTAQGHYLEKPVPPELRRSIQDSAGITLAISQFRADRGGGKTTPAEKLGLTIDYLAGKNRIDADEAKKLHAQLKNAGDAGELTDFGTMLGNKYLDAKAVRQWNKDVNLLYSFKADTLNQKTPRLFAHGLSPQRVYKVPQKQLDEYGRGYVDFTTKVREINDRIKAGKATSADLRVYLDEHSTPVNGLPSYAAIAWANSNPSEDDERTAVIQAAGKKWDTLTAVDKATLGKTTDPKVTEAWAAYDHNIANFKKQLPPGQRDIDAGQRLGLAKQVDKYYDLKGKFTSDFLFAKKPLYERLPYLKVIRDSPHKDAWTAIFTSAANAQKAIDQGQYTATEITDAWHDYADKLQAALKSDSPGFWGELAPILKADPSFLRKIFRAKPAEEG